jgi:hypothetical protein
MYVSIVPLIVFSLGGNLISAVRMSDGNVHELWTTTFSFIWKYRLETRHVDT